MIDVSSLVKAAKEKYPAHYAGMDDEQIYHVVRKRYPNLEWPESSPYDVDREVNPNKESLDASKQDYSPSAWEKIALAGLPEVWADKHDFAKRAYNHSMAGLIYQTMHGKSKYPVEEYETPIWEDAASFFLGLASIPDIALFLGTGGLGSLAGKKLGQKTIIKSLDNAIRKTGSAKVRDKLASRKLIAEVGLQSGLSLGTYGAAGGALAEAARQSSEGIEDFDYGKIIGESAKAFTSGAIIGAASGGVAKGIMSPKFAKAAMTAKKGNESIKNLSTRLLNNPLAQVIAEGQLFTAGQLTEQALIHGQDISMDDYFRGVFTNTGIIGGMRASTKILRQGQNDMTRYQKARRKHYDILKEKRGTVFENVKKELDEAGIKPPSELADELIKTNLEGQEQEGAFRWIKKQEKDLFHLMEDKKFENLTPEEQAKAVKRYVTLNNLYLDMYDKLITDKTLRDQVFESVERDTGRIHPKTGEPIKEHRKPTDAQSNTQKKKYEALLEKHKQISKFKNEFGLGDNKKGNETVSKLSKKEGVELEPSISVEKTAQNLIDEALNIGITKEAIELHKGKGIATLDAYNPKGYNMEGLRNLIQAKRTEGALGIIGEGSDLATSREKLKGFEDTRWKKNTELRNQDNVRDLADKNKYTILFTADRFLSGEQRNPAINEAVKFARWIEKSHPEASLASDGNILNNYYKQYLASIKETMLANNKDINQVKNRQNIVNTGLRTFYKNLRTRLSDKINPIPEGKAEFKIPKTQRRSVFVGELGKEETRDPQLAKLASPYIEGGKGGDVIISGEGKAFTQKNKVGKDTVVKKDMINSIISFARVVRPRANEFTQTKVSGFKPEINELHVIRNKSGAWSTIKTNESVNKFIQNHIDKYNLGKDDLLFFAERQGKRVPIKAGEVKYIVLDAIEKSGIDVQVYHPKHGIVSLNTPLGKEAVSGLPLTRIFRTFQEQGRGSAGVKEAESAGFIQDLGNKAVAKVSYDIGAKVDVTQAGTLRETLAPEGKVTPATKAQVERINKWAKEKFPEIEKKIVDKLEPDANGKEVLADLIGHTARIVRGKAPADALPHEIVHHVFNVLEAVGTPEAKRLMEQSIKAFDSKEQAVVRIGELVSGRLEKGLIPKAKAWVKRFNIFLKNLFGSPLKTKEADFLLSEMVYKKKGIPTAVSPKAAREATRETMVAPIREKYGTPEDLRKVVKRNFDVATENLGSTDKKDLVKYILGDVLGVPKDQFGKLIYRIKEKLTPELEDKYYEHLTNFNTVVETSGVEKLRRMKDVKGFFKTIRGIENLQNGERIIRNITEKEQIDHLLSVGVKDGDIWKSTPEQLQDYHNYLLEMAIEKTTDPSYIAEQRNFGLSNNKGLTKYQQILQQVEGAILPVVDVIRSLGFEKLANRLHDHVAQEQHHYGEGHQLMNYDITHGYTRKTKGGKTIEEVEPISGVTILGKNSKYEKLRDNISSVDHRGEMYLDALKWVENKELSVKEKKKLQAEIDFFEKAIKPEWKKTIKTKGLDGDALNAVDANGKFKYIDIKTDEGKIVARYADPVVGMPVYYKNAYFKALEANMNEAQYEAYRKQGDVKWIEDGIYINRTVTDNFKNVVNLEGKGFEKLIENQVARIATEEARRHYNVLNPSTSQIAEFRSFARGIAIGNIADANSFSFNRFSTKFLMKRHEKLPMFIKDNEGNWIRTYENTFDGTLKKYAVGMSKYIAGIEVFPEFGKIPGAKIPGAKVEIQELRNVKKGGEWADYVQEAVDHQLGIGKSSPFNMSLSAIQEAANILAKTQLSNPLSGVKNAFLATSQAAWAYDALDIGRGMADVFRQENNIYVTKTGAKHMGVRHYEGGKFSKLTDKYLFSLGLMRPSEGWARTFSVLTGKIDQKKNIEYLRSNPKDSKLYNKAKKRLETFYELPEADIKLLEKYGYGHGKSLDGHEFISKFEQGKMERKLETIHERMNSMAHIKTQGASIALYMPSFAGKAGVKPFTLYKRMAYAASVNTTKNMKEAYQSGNYMRLVSGTLATYFSGQALLGLYSEILGAPLPKENSGWWHNFWTAMWRGEFMGLMSEYWSPFGESAHMSLYPSLLENAGTLVMNAQQVIEGKKHFWGRKQAADSYLRSLVSIYNAGQHVIERRSNPYSNKAAKYNQLYKDFEGEVYPNKPDMDFEATTKTPYYIQLQNAFNKGSAKEFSKAFVLTYYALASDAYNKGFEINGVRHYSMNMAYKYANQQMENKMKALNPNRGRTTPKSKTQTKAKEYSWYKWLSKDEKKEYLKELKLLEGDYKRRLGEFSSQFEYFKRKNNLNDLRKEFDWIHKL